MFDTHCHLNFKAFDKNLDEVIKKAQKAGVETIVIPGTDVVTSKKAVEIAEKYGGVYAAVGIHPHHVFEIFKSSMPFSRQQNKGKSWLEKASSLNQIEELLKNPKVLAVGEIGLDRHIYKKTKYADYQVDEDFINLQRKLFLEQLKLAKKYQKTLIIHNRQAKKDLLELLNTYYFLLNTKIVFHCCEPDDELLYFAIKNNIFIGVDGDVVYSPEKQKFIKKVPLDLLVLETDSPFLSPFRKFPNTPENLKYIAEFVTKLKDISIEDLIKTTTKNANKLFFKE
ncbi:MAG: hydrolase TatD [Patescibacteria group bacterium]|nr:MAG: hydrolase TatD [Patescibacteria group bacterium]